MFEYSLSMVILRLKYCSFYNFVEKKEQQICSIVPLLDSACFWYGLKSLIKGAALASQSHVALDALPCI